MALATCLSFDFEVSLSSFEEDESEDEEEDEKEEEEEKESGVDSFEILLRFSLDSFETVNRAFLPLFFLHSAFFFS